MSSTFTRRKVLARLVGSTVVLTGLGKLQVAARQREAASFVDLANSWRDAARRLVLATRSGVEGQAFLVARNAAARASIKVMDAAAVSPRDVLIKYYVIYKSVYFTSYDLDFSKARFDAWCAQLQREARSSNLELPPFWWHAWSDPDARDRHLQKRAAFDWSEVRPWLIER